MLKRTRFIHIRITEEDFKRIIERAGNERSVSSVVREVVSEAFASKRVKKGGRK